MNPNPKSYKSVAIKALAVLGLLSLLLLVTFTTLSLGHFVSSGFSYVSSAAATLSSIFQRSSDTLVVKGDFVELQSGDPLTISYTYKGTKQGAYSLTYPCLSGFLFEIKNDDATNKTIPCATLFPISSTSLSLMPISTENRYVDMPITISFTEIGAVDSLASGTLTITVVNEKISNSTGYVNTKTTPKNIPEKVEEIGTLPKNTPTPKIPGEKTEQIFTPATTPNNPNGIADLKVTILEVGVVDKTTNAFAKTDTLRRSDRIGVRFSVENTGTKATGEWRFNAILPTFPPHTFNSEAEPSLLPGDHIEFTIGFDQSVDGKQIVKFVIDPQEAVKEVIEENNIATIDIMIL